MSFDKIFDDIQKLGKPQDGDLVLFQVEDGRWTAAIHPLLSQKFYAEEYGDIKQQALGYAKDKSDRGVRISVWKEGDANKGEYFRVL